MFMHQLHPTYTTIMLLCLIVDHIHQALPSVPHPEESCSACPVGFLLASFRALVPLSLITVQKSQCMMFFLSTVLEAHYTCRCTLHEHIMTNANCWLRIRMLDQQEVGAVNNRDAALNNWLSYTSLGSCFWINPLMDSEIAFENWLLKWWLGQRSWPTRSTLWCRTGHYGTQKTVQVSNHAALPSCSGSTQRNPHPFLSTAI